MQLMAPRGPYRRRDREAWQPSPRQRQVLDLMLEGMTNAEIARRLDISAAAVKWQVSELLSTTGLADRHALARWWREREHRPQSRGLLALLWPVRLRPQQVLGLAVTAGVVAVAAGLMLFGGSDGGLADDSHPVGLDVGEERPPMTPTTQPDENDLAVLDAIVIEWQRWSSEAGSWNSLVHRGGGSSQAALSLGYGGAPIVSPDGRFAAHADRYGEVTVYDLGAWQAVLRVQTARNLFVHAWTGDSTQVYGWREHCEQPAERGICPSGLQRDLWRIDIESGIAQMLVAFDFSAVSLAIPRQRDAVHAYALGVNTDICCAIDPTGDPFIAVLDLENHEVTARVPLAGVLAGQYEESVAGGDAFYPALLLTPDGSKLFLVDAAEDAVLVLDTQTFAIERRELQEKRSALRRFGDWLGSQLVGTAEAKGGGSFHRQAALKPDGRYLVIGGTNAQEVATGSGSTRLDSRPAGVSVIDTHDMTVVLRDKHASWFWLTADGRRLLTYGSYYDETLGQDDLGGGIAATGLNIFDLDTLAIVGHLWPGEEVRLDAFSPDGRFAYVSSEGPGMAAARKTGLGCQQDCFRLNLLDLEDGRIIWTGKLGMHQSVLAFPPPP